MKLVYLRTSKTRCLLPLQVYRLRGEDPEGSRVAYSISGDHLSVVRNTGAVTLVKPLDHETMPMIEVIITLTG